MGSNYQSNSDVEQNPIAEAHVVRDLAWAASAPEAVPSTPAVVFVPKDASVSGLERFAARPYRARAFVDLRDVPSFVDYVKQYRAADEAAIFANDGAITAVLNYRGAASEAPGHGDDQASLRYVQTPEWSAWRGVDSKRLSHAQFAEWLEDHVDDVLEPAGARIVEIAREFAVKRDVTFSSSVRLQSGANQLAYAEKDQTGVVELPEEIVLAIAPFEGTDRFRVRARIRYRLDAGKLVLWFALFRPDLVERTARDERVAAVRAALSAVPMFLGFCERIGEAR